MAKCVYRIDENGGAWDFQYADNDYVLPERTGNPETDLYEQEEFPQNDDDIMKMHEKRFWPHYAKVHMRRIRDSKLWDSDYMAYTDYPHTFSQAWKDYRQALRDVPANNPAPTLDGSPDWNVINVDWPDQPDYPANTGPM